VSEDSRTDDRITDGRELIDPVSYAENGAPHDIWTRLRRESPVHRCTPAGFEPFWAITKHADVSAISKQPALFSSAPGVVVLGDHQLKARADGNGLGAMKTIIEMDPPDHVAYRKVTSAWFTPRSMTRLDASIEESARRIFDDLAGAGGEGVCDWVTDVAVRHPLTILSTVLGLTPEEEPKVLELTNQLFASDDPDLRREGDDYDERVVALGAEIYALFERIIEDRRAHPTDDLATVIANAEVDGEQMGPLETFGYYLIIFTAGHDTTKNAIAGMMQQLLQHPEELAKLRANPDWIDSAVEEIVRWTAPVNYMKRTVLADTEVRGQKIAKGDFLAMFYASANRDEEVFTDPFDFRVDRHPNPHLGFGIGEHFCLGAHMAKRSLRALVAEMAHRLEAVTATGDASQIHSSFVVGLKQLPVSYRITP
jgi:cytochrome P450